MADLSDAPDADGAMNDPAGFGKDVTKYGLTFGIAGAAALAGWNYVAKPGFSAINQTVAALSDASEAAQESTGDLGVEWE
jgi:hypothetical protein